jgi:hypothetical protein
MHFPTHPQGIGVYYKKEDSRYSPCIPSSHYMHSDISQCAFRHAIPNSTPKTMKVAFAKDNKDKEATAVAAHDKAAAYKANHDPNKKGRVGMLAM